MKSVNSIAQVCHGANRAYCRTIGDDTQVDWSDAPEWQRDSAIKGVEFRMQNPSATPADMHQNWLNQKLVEGWRFGEVKDGEKKEHPCMLPYERLPIEQRMKDYLFSAIVQTMISGGD